MSFTDAVKTCFAKYFTFSGRASRPEYWWFFLFGILGSIVAGVFDGLLFGSVTVTREVSETGASFSADNNGPIGALFALAIFVPTISAGWRRMHDTGRSGLYLFYPMIVMIGLSSFVAMFGASIESGGVLVSGLVILAIVVLALSPFIVLFWLTRPSQPGSNQYGPNPTEVSP